MHHFQLRDGELHAEEVPLRKIAETIGTPCYVYSLATLQRHYQVFDAALTAAVTSGSNGHKSARKTTTKTKSSQKK